MNNENKRTVYNFQAMEVRSQGYQNLYEYCNGVTIINQGNTEVWVNEVHLAASPLNVAATDRFAGESLAIGGNENEVLNGRLKITFGAGTIPLVVIVQKYFIYG